MNPYQIVGIIAACALTFAGLVTLLAMQGMHVLVAFLLVYAVALASMVAMQRRARQSCDGEDEARAAGEGRRRVVSTRAEAVDARTVAFEPMRTAVGETRY